MKVETEILRPGHSSTYVHSEVASYSALSAFLKEKKSARFVSPYPSLGLSFASASNSKAQADHTASSLSSVVPLRPLS
jgi:hypothetical protein